MAWPYCRCHWQTEEMFALYVAIDEMSGDPGIGLKLGSEQRPEHYSPIAIAALYTRSFRDAMERIARYKRLTGPQENDTERGAVLAREHRLNVHLEE